MGKGLHARVLIRIAGDNSGNPFRTSNMRIHKEMIANEHTVSEKY